LSTRPLGDVIGARFAFIVSLNLLIYAEKSFMIFSDFYLSAQNFLKRQRNSELQG
jgi:hypothetical protein